MPSSREQAVVSLIALLLGLIFLAGGLLGMAGAGPNMAVGIWGLLLNHAYLNQSLGLFFLYWLWRQGGRRPTWVAMGVLVLAVGIEVWLNGFRSGPWRLRYPLFGSALGGSCALMLWWDCLRTGDARRRFELTCLTLQPLSLICSAWLMTVLRPPPRLSYDFYLYALDVSQLGFLLCARLRAFSVANPWALHLLDGVYNNLSLVMGLVQLLYFRFRGRLALNPIVVYVVQGILVGPLYTLMPATGTARLYGRKFPDEIPEWIEPSVFSLQAPVPMVCMPSMHTVWGLTVCYLLWPLGGNWRRVGVLYAGLLLVSVFSAGNHYLWDAYLAFPFTLASLLLCARLLGRSYPRRDFLGAALMAICWGLISFLRDGSKFWLGNAALLWALSTVLILVVLLSLRAVGGSAPARSR
jgi:hypothetical protein